ncbi:hypothetical protein Taro_020309 [Colocasia esculenta]|uniref:Uncharacterized protein n=1 Tax=Colocasia esculenta TaxID=4460 RepID=A0A843UZ87_COLES|nr:hypothetical protein [Colocasia esculenta]
MPKLQPPILQPPSTAIKRRLAPPATGNHHQPSKLLPPATTTSCRTCSHRLHHRTLQVFSLSLASTTASPHVPPTCLRHKACNPVALPSLLLAMGLTEHLIPDKEFACSEFQQYMEFNYLADKSWMYKYKSKHDRIKLKEWRCELKKKGYMKGENEELFVEPPEQRITQTTWDSLVDYWGIDEKEKVIEVCQEKDLMSSSEPTILSPILDVVCNGHHRGYERGCGL